MFQHSIQPRSGDVYIVMLADFVVAMDLAQTVADFSPQAHVILKANATDALEAALSADRIAVAFVGEAPQSFLQSALAEVIAQKGGRVVFVGAETEELAPDARCTILHQPFTSRTVTAYLHQLVERRAELRCACAG